MKYSIKSSLESPATILNVSNHTNFIYEVTGLDISDISKINNIKSKTKLLDRLYMIRPLGEKIEFHAGKGVDKDAMKKFEHLNLKYPQSRIVAKVKILDCMELNDEINKKIIKENELVYGNKYDRTGYAWKLELIEKVNVNKEISSKQGIWNIN